MRSLRFVTGLSFILTFLSAGIAIADEKAAGDSQSVTADKTDVDVEKARPVTDNAFTVPGTIVNRRLLYSEGRRFHPNPARIPTFPKSDQTLTGGWFGLSPKLDRYGVQLNLSLIQVYQINTHGGLSTHRRAGRYEGNYDLELNVDFEKLAHLNGLSMYAHAQGGWSQGIDPSSVGSIFGVNGNALGNQPIFISDLNFDQAFFGHKLVFRGGKMDLTGGYGCHDWPIAFDTNAYADDERTQFMNNAFVNDAAIPFPEPGLGLGVYVEPAKWMYVAAAVADADSNVHDTGFNTTFHGPADLFSIYEAGFTPRFKSANGTLSGTYRFGMWYEAKKLPRHNGRGTKSDNIGFYVSLDQMLYRENDKDKQGLGMFARYGYAPRETYTVTDFWSVGAQYEGLIPTRDKDIVAFGVAQGELSPAGDYATPRETAMECYYKAEITPWMHLSPSFQYILNPGGRATSDNAFILGMRLQLSF